MAPGVTGSSLLSARLARAPEPVAVGPPGETPGPTGPGAGRAGGAAGRPGASPTEKQVYENGDIFCIRTPFFMILGSLESQQRALQIYAYKHHSTPTE